MLSAKQGIAVSLVCRWGHNTACREFLGHST